MVWSVFGGPILGDQSEREAFPCSVALVLSFSEAFPCSVALVLRLPDFTKRCKNNGFGERCSFRGSLGESSWGTGLWCWTFVLKTQRKCYVLPFDVLFFVYISYQNEAAEGHQYFFTWKCNQNPGWFYGFGHMYYTHTPGSMNSLFSDFLMEFWSVILGCVRDYLREVLGDFEWRNKRK